MSAAVAKARASDATLVETSKVAAVIFSSTELMRFSSDRMAPKKVVSRSSTACDVFQDRRPYTESD